MDRGTSRAYIYRVLAADYACNESLFGQDGTFITEAKKLPGRRNYPFHKREFSMATTGNGVVIRSCPEYRSLAEENLKKLGRNDIFGFRTQALIDTFLRENGQALYGPILGYVCEMENLRVPEVTHGIDLKIMGRAEMLELVDTGGFDNAFSLRYDRERPNTLAAVARENSMIVGAAGASLDCEGLFQVGVNVLPEYRRQGIGNLVVGHLTKAILDTGAVPYYGTWAANIPSRNLAINVGYRPVFVEMFAGEPSDPEGG